MPLRGFLRQIGGVLGPESTLCLLVDQFEEFFLQRPDAQRAAFVDELAACLDDPSLNACWVLALRSEFFGRLATFRPRIRAPFANDFRLDRLTRAEAAQAVVQPAAQQGFSFEADLVEGLLDDLGGEEVAPPQVQLVCLALYESLAAEERMITRRAYERLGGAAGILQGHLQRVLEGRIPPEQRAPARQVIEALITFEGRRALRSRAQLFIPA